MKTILSIKEEVAIVEDSQNRITLLCKKFALKVFNKMQVLFDS